MKLLLPLLMMLTFSLTGCAMPAATPNTYRQIPIQEAAQAMTQNENFILLDVRTPEEYAGGHIPGAINIPNETIGMQDIVQLPDKAQLIYVYCRSGNRSKQAAEKLVKLGYTNIVEIGGVNAWPGELETE